MVGDIIAIADGLGSAEDDDDDDDVVVVVVELSLLSRVVGGGV